MKKNETVKKEKCWICGTKNAKESYVFCESCLDIWNQFPQKAKLKIRYLLDTYTNNGKVK